MREELDWGEGTGAFIYRALANGLTDMEGQIRLQGGRGVDGRHAVLVYIIL